MGKPIVCDPPPDDKWPEQGGLQVHREHGDGTEIHREDKK